LEHILLSDVFTPDEVTNILSEFDDETRASMSQLYLGFEPVIERSVGSLISSGAIDLQWIIDPQRNNMLPYLNRYYNLVAREQKKLNVQTSCNVLWIGSGPLPISAILMSPMSHVSITCIDISENAIAEGLRIIHLLGLEESIHVFLNNGADIDASPFDIVLIAVIATPAEDILHNIAKTTGNDCRIVRRVTYGLRTLMYPCENPRLRMTGYSLDRSDSAVGDQIISHVIYDPTQ
jgi:hypothetical protein